MKSTWCVIAAFGLIGASGPARAGEDKPTPTKEAYLGVSVEMVPSFLRSQLPDVLPAGQGLLVMHVAKDSPAGKAGLQAHDVLMTYGDQKLSSPDQLVKLVRGAAPGQSIAMNYLRGGKVTSCKVVLGERQTPTNTGKPRVFRFTPDEQLQKVFEESESTNNEAGWTSFDSMKLTRSDANHWQAEISFRTKDGKQETKKFAGTREEIRKAIQNEKDLPANEQAHLLRALNLHPPVFEFHFPPFEIQPPESKQP